MASLHKSLVKKLSQVAPKHSSSSFSSSLGELEEGQWKGADLYGSVWTH